VIPKRWRYLETLPLDTQGKKKKEDIALLFDDPSTDPFTDEKRPTGSGVFGSVAFGGLDGERIIDKNENSVSLEFSVPNSSPYFDGHFPGFSILPAVAQAELVVRFASRHLGTGVPLSEIRRIKFTNIIRPFTPLLLALEKKGNVISFSLKSPGGEIAYSSGIVIPGDE
jgi:3-hydroxymyristoyl/3-hydroxydecanoyl-(acyl carrier protein) dehydratase